MRSSLSSDAIHLLAGSPDLPIELFAVQFKLWHLPYLPTGADIWDPRDLLQLVRHLILPVFCLVAIQTAGYSRYLRSSILEVLGLDYVRTARAKGLSSRAVLFKHVVRNAALPFVTLVGLDIPFLLGGALVTESVFAWPGMGRLFWEYAERGDYPVVLGVLLVTSGPGVTNALTGVGVVDRIITDLGVFDVTDRGFVVVELAPGVSLEQARAQSDAEIHTPS